MRKIIAIFFMTLFSVMAICFDMEFKVSAETISTSDMITMDLNDYRSNYSFDYGLDDLYGEMNKTTAAKSNSSGSTTKTTASSFFGRKGFDIKDLQGISLPDVYDILDELFAAFDGVGIKVAFFLVFLLAILWCFCGYRVFHVFAGITAFILCNLTGIFVAVVENGGAGKYLVFFVISIILLVLCIKFKSFAAFLLGSVNSLPFFALIFLLICKKFNGVWLILTLLFAVALGILMAIFKKPIIIITTAVEWGPIAGTALACLIKHTHWGIWFGILFMVGGLLYQSHYHGGLLESGPILFKKNAAKSAASEKPLGGKIEEQTSSDGSASYAKPVPVETKPVHSPSPARSYSKFEDIPPKEFPSPASEPITPLPAAASARVAPPSPAFSSVSTTSEESSADDAKLKFGTFTRVPEAPSPSAAPGELKINMAEGKPEVRRPDPNSKMKRADDFDD